MPVYLDRPLPRHAGCLRDSQASGDQPFARDALEIGIINNMPDRALQATERQFLTLLEAAAGHLSVRVGFYNLAGVPRGEAARRHVADCYCSADELSNRHLDGLIVTGTEPRSPDLASEPYWNSVTWLIDWAERNTTSSIWSCLAAHAAVLYLDGLERWRLDQKRFGLFRCVVANQHPLTDGTPPCFTVAHSRWNELREQDLLGEGYRILTKSEEAGVDAFVKQRGSLFLFFQGHAEYEANTLLFEYRRDISRYLRGERESYPAMPAHYFGPAAGHALLDFQERATRARREELLLEFPANLLAPDLWNQARPAARRVYRNWLRHLAARKRRPSSKAALCRTASAGTMALRESSPARTDPTPPAPGLQRTGIYACAQNLRHRTYE
ncbi:MAG TPA: homoserine O-succinyltransferase [Bryobacteraceae bacterium]|nr:homoserine O-succinyltransferase [Bryobacteraceae bacterium]